MLRAYALQKGVELRAVVHMLQVAELVEHHIVPEFFGQAHQVKVKVDVSLDRAAAPIAHIVLDTHLVIPETIQFRQLFKSSGQICLGLGAELLHLRRLRQLPPRPAPADHYPHTARKYVAQSDFHFGKDSLNLRLFRYLCVLCLPKHTSMARLRVCSPK